jgi:hypothetical protein
MIHCRQSYWESLSKHYIFRDKTSTQLAEQTAALPSMLFEVSQSGTSIIEPKLSLSFIPLQNVHLYIWAFVGTISRPEIVVQIVIQPLDVSEISRASFLLSKGKDIPQPQLHEVQHTRYCTKRLAGRTHAEVLRDCSFPG